MRLTRRRTGGPTPPLPRSKVNPIKRLAVALERALEADFGRRLFDEAEDDGALQFRERIAHGLGLEKALREGAVAADFTIKHARQVIKKLRFIVFPNLRDVPGIKRLRRRMAERNLLLAAGRQLKDGGCAFGAQINHFAERRVAKIFKHHRV